jgi:hypothetical protein
MGVTVIVVSFFESVFADHSKDHPVAVPDDYEWPA